MQRQPWKKFGLITYDTPNDAGGGLEGARQGAADRLEAAGTIVDTPADGDPPAPVVDPQQTPQVGDDGLEGFDFNNLSYADGKKLEKEIQKDRQRYRPYEQAFSSLDDDARDALLRAAPGLGPDLAAITGVFSDLHAGDRQVILDTLQLFATDPVAAGERFQKIADVLSSQGVTPEVPAPTGDGGEDDEPMTRAEMRAMFAERDQQAAQQRAVDDQYQAIRSEMVGLGYDPNSEDEHEQRKVLFLLAAAASLDNNIAKAHEVVQGYTQGEIDAFVKGKSADAARPPAPTAGASPSGQQPILTLEDARSAAAARLEGVLGPSSR